MLNDIIRIWDEDECTYSNGQYQLQYIDTYIHEDDEERPAVLIVPGGAYQMVASNESDNVARRFFDLGYQAFVLVYTVDKFHATPLKLQPLNDISRAMRYIRSNSEQFRIFEGKIAVCGFSAGGHLAASLCVHYDDIEDAKYPGVSNRPDGAILCYPVITTGHYAHQESIDTLLGPMASLDEIKYMSLEKNVTENTPPCFIWTTATDELVPYENSELFAKALRENKIPYSLHIFSEGRHGRDLGEATETEDEIHEIMTWPELADIFLIRHML